LPDTTGPELARRIRDRGAHLPILFMSGYTETVLGEAALDPEAEFLETPFTPQTLIRKVRELLGEPLA
ncbi:MAG: hybrid sensor histidine kinase/response regulator, partial [Gemmatimonadetes bacterium]|nr:hybrid sensor histidine kinase/response regulator [Gemmatimonadota bacterium]